MAEADSTGNDSNEGPLNLKRKSRASEDEEENNRERKEFRLDSSVEGLEDFAGFQVSRVLTNSPDFKRIVVQGVLNGQSAIAILDKKPFPEDIGDLFTSRNRLRHTFQNDIYGSYDCLPMNEFAEIKTTLIYPATQKHIDKYVYQPIHLVDETADLYQSVTLPYLTSSQFNIQWVFNILEHKKETERIVFEDPNPETGFILLPDLKWDGVALENLYLVAIVHKKGIKSLRDLNETHLPLLENILNSGSRAIEDKYGLKRSQLRIYIHYQPSYYHLHIHFTSLRFNAPGIFAEKSHILQSVIGNIRQKNSFYQEATLPFVIKQFEPLYEKLVENGYTF